jgi:hypothetical protein
LTEAGAGVGVSAGVAVCAESRGAPNLASFSIRAASSLAKAIISSAVSSSGTPISISSRAVSTAMSSNDRNPWSISTATSSGAAPGRDRN